MAYGYRNLILTTLSDISIKESLANRATSTGVAKKGFFQIKNLVEVAILGLQNKGRAKNIN